MYELNEGKAPGWPRAFVSFSAEILAEIFQGGTIHANIVTGLPGDAVPVGIDFDRDQAVFRVVFASQQFAPNRPGEPIPNFGPVEVESLEGHYVFKEHFPDPIVHLQTEKGQAELATAMAGYRELQESGEAEPDARDVIIKIMANGLADSAVLIEHVKSLLYEGSPRKLTPDEQARIDERRKGVLDDGDGNAKNDGISGEETAPEN